MSVPKRLTKKTASCQHTRQHQIAVQYALNSRRDLPAARSIRAWSEAALNHCNTATAELTIRLVNETDITALNQQYRNQTGPTNVLSFPVPELGIPADPLPLGDVLICPTVALRESQQQHKTLRAHVAHLVVHGVLHLLGHDHQQPNQAEAMETLERQILTGLGFADPYLIVAE